MTSGPDRPFPPKPENKGRTGRRSPLIPTLIIVGVIVVAFVFVTQVYADVLWYQQLGYLDVFITENVTQILLFLSTFLVVGASIYFSLRVAYRSRPVYAPDNAMQDNLNRYQEQLEPVRRAVMLGIPVVVAVFAGTAAASQWQNVLLFFHQVPFGQTDPEFGLDFSFYLYTLPFFNFVLGFLMTAVVISGIVAILTHYLYGGIRLEEKGIFTSKAARVQISVTAALFLILQGVNLWLDRYATLQSNDGKWAGALYTDVTAVIPTKAILAIAALIVAALFIVAAVVGKWRLPVIGTAMLLITGILAGGVYPWVIQRFEVTPSEQSKEREYIQRNIDLTRLAYGLEDTEVTTYDATSEAEAGALREDAETTANIRLLDPNLVSDTFSQLQQFRQYYQFDETLNVDRYEVDGKTKDTVIAVRELNTDGVPDNWLNQHALYTHGYGVVAAQGAKVQPDGKPAFMLSGIPSSGVLGNDSTYEPRIYFGEFSPEYSIVGAPEGTDPQEVDRPQGEEGGEEAKNTFKGDGGPSVGNLFNKLAYSIKFQSTDLLLSDVVNEDSQIIYERDPRERVKKLAPYLTVDSNVYPAIIDGRVKWIVDGYTTSNNFPYSAPQELQAATRDSLSAGGGVLPAENVNYIRNAVKATVDAYDGSVTMYAWDDEDPILKAWQSIFPTVLKPYSEMSGELMSHVRYPEDQFKVQRELMGRYHVTNADTFFSNIDAWSVPDDPTEPEDSNVKQPPFYLSLQMPKQKEAAFSLTTPFVPSASNPTEEARNVLYGFLAADADAGDKDGVKAEGYGTLRLLDTSRSDAVPGPGQAQNKFNSDPTVSTELNLLSRGASEVKRGNLLTLPIGGGILYVQPVYVQSSGSSSYPTLQRVLVSFGENVGFAPTLDEALDQVFDGDSGAAAGDVDNVGETGGETPASEAPDANATAEENLKDALAAAGAALQDGQAALAEGDFAAYGEAQKKLDAAIAKAMEAEAKISGVAPPAEDGGAPEPSESPKADTESGS